MPSEFSVTRKVEFAETDMAGIMHFSNFFRYMEVAEHAFFRSLGFSIVTEKSGHDVGWPRVHASCDYMRPLRFEDDVEILGEELGCLGLVGLGMHVVPEVDEDLHVAPEELGRHAFGGGADDETASLGAHLLGDLA